MSFALVAACGASPPPSPPPSPPVLATADYTMYLPGTSAANLAELEQILASIRFEP